MPLGLGPPSLANGLFVDVFVDVTTTQYPQTTTLKKTKQQNKQKQKQQ